MKSYLGVPAATLVRLLLCAYASLPWGKRKAIACLLTEFNQAKSKKQKREIIESLAECSLRAVQALDDNFPESMSKATGKRIRSIREEAKLSQIEVNKRTGIAQSYLSSIENGKHLPEEDTIHKLATALSCDANELIPM